MHQQLTEEAIKQAITKAFYKPERIESIILRDWHLTISINCDYRYGKLNFSELVRLAEELDLPLANFEIWDIKPNVLEIFVDCDALTPVERPTSLKNLKK